MLHQLAYMSTTARRWTRPDLLELLRVARARNDALGVTGILLHRHEGFLQLLEGGREQVELLYRAIRLDARHAEVTVIWKTEGAARWFTDWSMAFRDLEDDPVVEPGLTDVLRGRIDASAFSHEVVLQLWNLLRAPGPLLGRA